MLLAAFQYSLRFILDALRIFLIRNIPFGTHEAKVIRVSQPILPHSQYNHQNNCVRGILSSVPPSWDAVGLIEIHSQVQLRVYDYNPIPIRIVGSEL